MGERRTFFARAVVLAAALLVVAAAVSGYVRHELLRSDHFSDRATRALKDRDVRDFVGRELTDKIVLKADPDLLAARPLIESVTADLAGSGPFLALYGSAVKRLHTSVLSGEDSRLQLDLRDAGILVQSALQRLEPSIARKLNVADIRLDAGRGAAGDAAAAARTLRRLSWFLLGAALLAIAGGIALAPRPERRDVLRLFGIATGVAALLALAALWIARRVVAETIGGDELAQRAFLAVWDALLGDLNGLLIAVGAGGAVTAAIAATRGDLPDLEPLLDRAWARLRARPRTEWRRAARALAVLVAGIMVLLDPAAAVRIVASVAGVGLIYLGADELLAVLQRRLGPLRAPEPEEDDEAAPPRGAPLWRRAMPVTVVGALAAAGIALFAVGGGVDPPASASPTGRCNGHVELCAKRLDQVVLPATHNAMSAGDLRGWFAAEQEKSIPAQLQAGVRGLLIDAHYGIAVKGGVRTDLSQRSERAGDADRALYEKSLGREGLAAIQRIRDRVIPGDGRPGVYLCHRFCELGATDLDAALRQIHQFLVLNPGEVVAIVIEDYVLPSDLVAAFRRTGLSDLVYTGPPAGPFPTLRQMIDADQRVVVYTERVGGGAPWLTAGYARAIQETPYTFKRASLLTDPAQLPASCRPNRGPATAPLFLVNHWVNTDPTPKITDARKVNARDVLVRRARECERARGHVPNLLAVNFYATGDLLAAVDELNGVSPARRKSS